MQLQKNNLFLLSLPPFFLSKINKNTSYIYINEYISYLSQKYENMVTSCLFGILVFGSDITLIYRFLTNDFYTYLYKYFCERQYSFDGNNDVSLLGYI